MSRSLVLTVQGRLPSQAGSRPLQKPGRVWGQVPGHQGATLGRAGGSCGAGFVHFSALSTQQGCQAFLSDTFFCCFIVFLCFYLY